MIWKPVIKINSIAPTVNFGILDPPLCSAVYIHYSYSSFLPLIIMGMERENDRELTMGISDKSWFQNSKLSTKIDSRWIKDSYYLPYGLNIQHPPLSNICAPELENHESRLDD